MWPYVVGCRDLMFLPWTGCGGKHYNWYKKLFVCIGNACWTYRKSTPKRTEIVLFWVPCKVLFSSLRPAVPNERLFVDDAVSRLFGRHFSSNKITPENAVKSVSCLLCQRKAYMYTAKGGYLKTTFVWPLCGLGFLCPATIITINYHLYYLYYYYIH